MKTNYKLVALLLFITVGITGSLHAQSKKMRYSQNLEAFTGTWEYTSSNEVFRIVLKKGQLNTDDFYGNYLLGGYSYRKNGTLMGDYTQNIPEEFTEANYEFENGPALSGTNGSSNPLMVTPNKADLDFNDFTFHKLGDVTFTLLSPTTAHFQLREEWGRGGPGIRGFSIPTDVVMTKVQ